MSSISLNTLSNTPGARHPRRTRGRGNASGLGGTSGRGHKGQFARSGHKHKAGFEGGQMRLIRRVPKRGFNHSGKRVFALVSVGSLKSFAAGTEVTPALLASTGRVKGRFDGVKVLGGGELDVKLSVKAHAFSASAREKITAAGGTCEVLS